MVTKYAHRQLYNAFHPRVVLPLKITGRVVPENIVRESVAFFIIYQSVYLFSILGLTALGIDFVTALSGTAATVGIVGPGSAPWVQPPTTPRCRTSRRRSSSSTHAAGWTSGRSLSLCVPHSGERPDDSGGAYHLESPTGGTVWKSRSSSTISGRCWR